MIGTSITGVVRAYEEEASDVLKTTKGDMGKIIRHAIKELGDQKLISTKDSKVLTESFAEALDVLVGKKKTDEALRASRKRFASLVKDPQSTDLASGLADLCQSVIAEVATRPGGKAPGAAAPNPVATEAAADALPDVATAASSTVVTGKAEQALLWGALGALVGGSMGGPAGALVGAGVGAAFGGCVGGDTTITPTNSGGSPA